MAENPLYLKNFAPQKYGFGGHLCLSDDFCGNSDEFPCSL